MKKIITSILCLSMLSLTSCSARSNTAVSQEVRPAPDFAPLTEIHEGNKNLYLIVKNLESSYWQVILDGAKQAGDDFGCNIYYSGTYAETDWIYQEQLLEDSIQANADAVLISPDDSVMLAEEISKVYNSGIRVVLIDTTANTEDYDVCYMTDNLIAGQNAAAEMISRISSRGYGNEDKLRVGIIVGSTASQTINERLAGFFQYWTKNAPENWEIITDIKCCEGSAELAASCAEEIMEEYPDTAGIYSTNNSPTSGSATAIRENGRTDITIVGFDYSSEIAELIESPDYSAATMLQRQYDMSYQGVAAALELISGGEISTKFIDTGVVTVNSETQYADDVQSVIKHN